MKGLYLDIPGAAETIERWNDQLGLPTHLAAIRHGPHEILVSHHPQDWPAGPIFTNPERGITAAASGWFVYKGRSGDLRALAPALAAAVDAPARRAALAGIDAGAFVILVCAGERIMLVTDPFGLHPHYYPGDEPFSALAPSPGFVRGEVPADPVLAAALDAQDHLFGNLTAYLNVRRLEPGCVLLPGRREPYFEYTPGPWDPAATLAALRRALAHFTGRRRILPLSGGLDSRLLLALGEFDCGFTFGPERTGDRPVARRFRQRFEDYWEFSLLDLEYRDAWREVGRAMFDGVCARPFVELLAVFGAARKRWGPGCLFFDGYVGDVLQRATLLTAGGVAGSLAKLVPALTMTRFDPHRLLRRRYPRIPRAAYERLIATYESKTAGWALDEPRKLLLFELLYGKGARHALNGGTILSGQFFSSVQPFVMPEVFRAFWGLDPRRAVTYRGLCELWRHVPDEYSRVPTYSGFVPVWPADIARATMLVVKGLEKKGLLRRARSYERERPRVRWL